jgi:hypothetical protein
VLDHTWRLFRSEVSDDIGLSDLPRLIGYEEIDAQGDSLRSYIDRLQALTLPLGPLPHDMGGLDGTTFHLAIFGSLAEVRFRWWMEGPPPWAPLVGIANEMIEAFRLLHPRAL